MTARQAAIDEALDAFEEATRRVDDLQLQVQQACRDRASALALLHNLGLTYAEISDMTGISAPRVGQLITSLREPSGSGEDGR